MGLRIKVFFFLFFGTHSLALASVLEGDWDLSGQMVMESRIYQKPSSLTGASSFSIPWMTLDARFVSRDGGELFLQFLGVSPAPVGQNEFQLRQASFFLPQVLGESVDLRAGLLASELSQRLRSYWPVSNVANELDFSLQRWGYQAFSDYGFELFGNLGGDATTLVWGFQMTNGEGRGKPEQGPQKDLQAWIAAEWGSDSAVLAYLMVRRGAYENIPVPQAMKERYVLGVWAQQNRGWSGGLDLFVTSDPVDAINGQVAESVDLTVMGGQRVKGRGVSTLVRYIWSDQQDRLWQIFAKSDLLEPVMEDKDRQVMSQNFGLMFSPRVNVQWVFYHSQTWTGALHNLNTKEQQSWRLALNVDLND